MSELEQLYTRIRALEADPQSPEREQRLAVLNFERREIEAHREYERCRRARLLFNAYFRTGKMTAIHPSGVRRDGSPHPADGVQGIWNIRSEAESLAAWSIP